VEESSSEVGVHDISGAKKNPHPATEGGTHKNVKRKALKKLDSFSKEER